MRLFLLCKVVDDTSGHYGFSASQYTMVCATGAKATAFLTSDQSPSMCRDQVGYVHMCSLYTPRCGIQLPYDAA